MWWIRDGEEALVDDEMSGIMFNREINEIKSFGIFTYFVRRKCPFLTTRPR